VTPSAILSRAESLGLTITPDGENLRIRGPRDAIAEITPLVKAHKPAIIAALAANDAPLPQDLERLIRRAGAYWEYSPDDFRLIYEVARTDADGLRRALENDVAFSRSQEGGES
jgi:hypothetical protein